MSFSSFKGVSPAACTSPTSGSEIFPSDRTGIEREISGSFQTLIASTSSLPITKLSSCGFAAETSVTEAVFADGLVWFASGPPAVWARSVPDRKAQTVSTVRAPVFHVQLLILINAPWQLLPDVLC